MEASDRILNIGVDARPLLTPHNGIGRCTYELLSRLVESKHNWFLYSDGPIEQIKFDRLNVKKRNIMHFGGVTGTFTAQIIYPLWSRIDELDIFWSPRHHLPLCMPSSVQLIVSVYDLVWKRFPRTMTKMGLMQEMLIMPSSLRKATSILAVSNFTRNELGQYYPEYLNKVEVVKAASSIQHVFGEKALIEKPEYFLFVGTKEPRKNLDFLLKAYAQYSRVSCCVLPLRIVAGQGWGDDNIKKIVSDEGLGGLIGFHNDVDDVALRELYLGARALLIPSVYEGFGLPVVEGMALGVPSLISENTSLVEVAGDSGLVVNPLCVDSISKGIRLLAENNSVREELSSNALKQSLMFTWERSAEKTLGVFEGITLPAGSH